MRLIILHGSGLSAIANKIFATRKNFDPLAVTEINCKEKDLGQVLAEISTPQLFAEQRLVVLENLEPASDLSKLPGDEKLTIALKFSKKLLPASEILKSTLRFKPQTILLEEKDETSIFPFLDMLGEKNKRAFGELGKYLEEWGGQYVLTMIFYFLRRMVISSKKMPSFMAAKIDRQKKNFNLEKIQELYKEVIETDFRIKSGLIEEKLALTLLVEKILDPD